MQLRLNYLHLQSDSRFSLTPRGYGRTSYHLCETIQVGLVPVHVYSDVPWVPYADLFKEIGFVSDSTNTGLGNLVSELKGISLQQFEEKERRIESLISSHFSVAGVLQQISLFMRGEANDLRCQALPQTTRDG